jgi:hypothetical protein
MPPNAEDATPRSAAPVGRGLWTARLIVVLALCIGLGFFGISAINTLANGINTPTATKADTLAIDPDAPAPLGGDVLSARNASEALSPQYIPIDHDPAHLTPYPGSSRDVCFRLPDGQGFADEQARYLIVDGTVEQARDHYRRTAEAAGFTLAEQRPYDSVPGGILMNFRRDDQTLVVGIAPRDTGPPPPPPRRAVPQTSVAVQFRYPTVPRP